MIEIAYLKELILLLKSNSVSSFKSGDLELKLALSSIGPDLEDPLPKGYIPPDIKTDPITSMDDILHWSSQSEDPAIAMPLTGDAPLNN